MFINPNHNPINRIFYNGEAGGNAGAGGGDGGTGGAGDAGNNSGAGAGAGGNEPQPKLLTEDQFNQRMQQRVGETQKATEDRIAKELGVSIEEAKRLVEVAKAKEDSEKSEAQKAADAANKAKADSDAAAAVSAQTTHDAAIERALIRAIKIPEGVEDEDDYIDRKVSRLARLIDVDLGADAAAIKTAVNVLKSEEPLLFGLVEGEGETPPPKPGAPAGDPKGTPPKRTTNESAYDKGVQRAKGTGDRSQYPILEKSS